MLSKRNTILFTSAVIACAIGLFIITYTRRNIAVVSVPPQPTSTIAVTTTIAGTTTAMTTQKQIDMHLSLEPPITPTPAPKTSSSAPVGCSLTLAFNETSGNIEAAGTMDYTLAAKNLGNAPCESASVSIYYATNEVFVSATPEATADGYYWRINTLAPGQEIDIALVTNRTAPLATGDTTDEACLSADNGTDACANAGSAATPASVPESGSPQAAKTQTATVGAATLAPEPGKELGVWVWTPISHMSPSEIQQTVSEAEENHFNAIYITVDEYLSIAQNGPAALANYEQNVSTFITLANADGIAVDAEAGARDWGQPGDTAPAPAIVSFVSQYNATHSAKFRGVQFDIEPYLLPGYANNESQILTNFSDLVDTLAVQATADHLPLTIVLPHFFDQNIKWTPSITVDGVTDYTYNQVLRILNRSIGNRVIVMAYRNTADGGNGAIAISQTEVDDADTTNVRVIVAQETGPVTPSYVTFNGLTKGNLATQAATIGAAYASDTSFDGIAIDYLGPFLQLSS